MIEGIDALEEGEWEDDSSPNQGSQRIHIPTMVGAKDSSVIQDSPASPDGSFPVTGSPLKIIPSSPRPGAPVVAAKDEEEEESDMDEDIDEGILYLRLMALKSMSAETEEEKMEREMHLLLDEANQAELENTPGTYVQ